MDKYIPSGTKLIDSKGGNPIDIETALADKDILLLYFSAHWCPPCRAFTPELIKFYETHAESKKFEIVFVSHDSDEDQFADYFSKMPWKSFDYDSSEQLRTDLAAACGVSGIPALLVFDAKTGELLTRAGRGQVSRDPEAQEFPWKGAQEAEGCSIM